jgi:drug/metabolite transporter (DMT)-like permease
MLPQVKNQNFQAGLIALAGVVMFSAKSVFAKMAYVYKVGPISVIYLRMLFALPFVVIMGIWFERNKKQEKIQLKDIILVFGISMLGYYISSLCDFIGLLYVEASIERLILFLYPTFVIIISAIFLKKNINIYQIISIVIAYSGLLLAFGNKMNMKNSNLFWYGAILIVFSSLTYAIFLVIADGLIARLGSFRFTTLAILSMCLCIIVHAMFSGKAKISGYNHHVYFDCLLMAIFSTVIPIYMFNYAIEKLGSSNVSIISCAGPICTLMYSSVLLNEVITLYQVLGTFIVVGGILIIYFRKKQ